MKRYFAGKLLLVFMICGLLCGRAWPETSLVSRLAAEKGVDRKLLEQLRAGDFFAVDTGIVARNLKQSEYKAAYERFLQPPAVRKAAAFLAENRSWLKPVANRYGVDAEVITAIFLVESDLGRYPGRYPLLKVFSSLALCDRKACLDEVYRKLRPRHPRLDYAWLEKRARKKAAWGYRQLVALLKLSDRLEVKKVKGSWAGAFGICQFIPTSCLTYAVDGSGDGRIDLYDFEDAAASVANYLKINGWRPGLDREKREKVIWSYNHSRLYCRTIVELAERLRHSPSSGKRRHEQR